VDQIKNFLNKVYNGKMSKSDKEFYLNGITRGEGLREKVKELFKKFEKK